MSNARIEVRYYNQSGEEAIHVIEVTDQDFLTNLCNGEIYYTDVTILGCNLVYGDGICETDDPSGYEVNLYYNNGDTYIWRNESLDPSSVPFTMNDIIGQVLIYTCETMGSVIWNGAANVTAGGSFNLISALLVPPLPPDGMVLWHCRLSITKYRPYLVPWEENVIQRRSFGNVIIRYHGYDAGIIPIHSSSSYLGLFERMPGFPAKATTDLVTFGLRLTSRQRCDSLLFDFKPGTSGILLYSAILILMGNSEYI